MCPKVSICSHANKCQFDKLGRDYNKVIIIREEKNNEEKERIYTSFILAVIVILAVMLVIAVPQIMSVIESARKGSIELTAKLIVEGAEREYTNRKILGKDTNIKCSDVCDKIIGAGGCGNFYVDSITDNVIKISQNTGPC